MNKTVSKLQLPPAALIKHSNSTLAHSFKDRMVGWPVLHNKPTVTSLHRSVYVPPLGPRDSLDIHLTSCYSHNRELFPQTSDVMRHPSRLSNIQRPCVTLRSPDGPVPVPPQGITYGGLTDRPSIHSVKLGISANHIAQTNQGFSRKLDGTFYSL